MRLDVLIVGGAAVMLTGLVVAERNTSDVDVMAVDPSVAEDDLGRLRKQRPGTWGFQWIG